MNDEKYEVSKERNGFNAIPLGPLKSFPNFNGPIPAEPLDLSVESSPLATHSPVGATSLIAPINEDGNLMQHGSLKVAGNECIQSPKTLHCPSLNDIAAPCSSDSAKLIAPTDFPLSPSIQNSHMAPPQSQPSNPTCFPSKVGNKQTKHPTHIPSRFIDLEDKVFLGEMGNDRNPIEEAHTNRPNRSPAVAATIAAVAAAAVKVPPLFLLPMAFSLDRKRSSDR
ncbi:hypothetical protein Lal_00025279 [Lupinus albus]|nr:hypothetical protein Lal_00025279 [Lupinus albus]